MRKTDLRTFLDRYDTLLVDMDGVLTRYGAFTNAEAAHHPKDRQTRPQSLACAPAGVSVSEPTPSEWKLLGGGLTLSSVVAWIQVTHCF
jgi:hypothetical protein